MQIWAGETGIEPCRASGIIRGRLALVGAVLAALLVLLSPSEGIAACAITGTNQTCANSVVISGGAIGINDTATLTLTDTDAGRVVGTDFVIGYGIHAGTANVSKWGTISGTGGFGAQGTPLQEGTL